MKTKKVIPEFRMPHDLEGYSELLAQIQADKKTPIFPEFASEVLRKFNSPYYYKYMIRNGINATYNQALLQKVSNQNVTLADWNKTPVNFKTQLLDSFDYGTVVSPVILHFNKQNVDFIISGKFTVLVSKIRNHGFIQVCKVNV